METPAISSNTYTTNAVSWEQFDAIDPSVIAGQKFDKDQFKRAIQTMTAGVAKPLIGKYHASETAADMAAEKEQPVAASMRIVKVFIADPSESIPLAKRMIYSGEEKTTDLIDQELFFEVEIGALLKKHNEFRITLNDKVQTEKFGREIKLEPVRIRDLKMVVVEIAKF